MAKEKPERDDVLRRLLKTPPKPHEPSKTDIDKAAEELGLNDPNADFGSEAWKRRHEKEP